MNEASVPSRRHLTVVAAAVVLVLALASLLVPRKGGRPGSLPLLVYDTSGEHWRTEAVHVPLAQVLSAASQRRVVASVYADTATLRAAASGDAFVLAPDGLALRLDPDRFVPVAAVRRPPPRNLRPRGVLVHRRGTTVPPRPWRTDPARLVLGDSLGLTAVGAWTLSDGAAPAILPACGPDPFDHGPALHALRLGCFDFALVRQWDAERFLAAGLLAAEEWSLLPVTPPVPDLVLLVPRSLSAARRLGVTEALRRVGRVPEAATSADARLEAGLARLRLAGFNPLLEPELDQLRRRWRDGWPPGGE